MSMFTGVAFRSIGNGLGVGFAWSGAERRGERRMREGKVYLKGQILPTFWRGAGSLEYSFSCYCYFCFYCLAHSALRNKSSTLTFLYFTPLAFFQTSSQTMSTSATTASPPLPRLGSLPAALEASVPPLPSLSSHPATKSFAPPVTPKPSRTSPILAQSP